MPSCSAWNIVIVFLKHIFTMYGLIVWPFVVIFAAWQVYNDIQMNYFFKMNDEFMRYNLYMSTAECIESSDILFHAFLLHISSRAHVLNLC